jgi:hypothetical protein
MELIISNTKAALHRFEVATRVAVGHKHQKPMIEQGFALGGHDALKAFQQACSYWRKDYASRSSRDLAAVPGSEKWHPALDRFAMAYHNAKDNTLRRAALEVSFFFD